MMTMVVLASLAASTAVAPALSLPPQPAPSIATVVGNVTPRLSARPGVEQRIAVQVLQDGRVAWSGEMSRSSTGNASFNQQLRESRVCPSNGARFSNASFESTGLNVSISPDYPLSADRDADDMVQVAVERTRPYGDSAACAGEHGSSTVRFTAAAKLVPGQAVTVSGEGQLSVVLTLR